MFASTVEPRPGSPLILLLPLLAAGKMSDTLRAAAACGVERVIVWTPERGKIPAGAGNPDRWRAVTVDAGRVAHSAWLPELLGPLPLAEAFTRTVGTTLLLLDRSGARDWRPAHPAPAAGHALVIGPESGFSETEIAACRAAGAVALSLGPATLRVEQAVLAALAVLRYLAG
jgi:16S rRNA (uracil1498-N3)-methyltransferase